MPSLTITNQKGGVGKTTTTLNLAAALKEMGLRVLIVDFDPQGSLTTSCGLSDPTELGRGQTIADALLTTMHLPVPEPVSILDVIVPSPAGLDLVPSNHQLASAERVLYGVYGREFALRDTLAPIKSKYDLILVDSVPTIGLLAINSLVAVEGLLIPVQAEFLAVHGLAQVLDSVKEVRERLNSALQVWGVALTMVDGRTKHSREIVQLVRESLPGQVPVFNTEIPVDVKIKESSRAGRSVLQHDSRSRGARAYRELAKEVAVLIPTVRIPTSSVQTSGISTDVATSDRGAVPDPASVATQVRAPASTSGGDSVSSSPTFSTVVGTDAHAPAKSKVNETNGKVATTNGNVAAPMTPRLPGVCPYLGLHYNARAHDRQPTVDHLCFAARPALPIEARYQFISCLTTQHPSCDRFFRATVNSVVAPSVTPQSGNDRSVLSRLRKFMVREA